MSHPFFPMMINLEGRKVLIVGGGNIASRRANTLITCGSEVIAVSPEFNSDFPSEAVRVVRKFKPEDISNDICLVIAATNDRTVNSLIHATSKSLSIPVNVADNPAECDFIFPSLIASGHVAVSVCSAGDSPGLTRRLSDRLRNVWDSWVNEEGRVVRANRGMILAAVIACVILIFAGGVIVEVEDSDYDFPAYLEDDGGESWREYVVPLAAAMSKYIPLKVTAYTIQPDDSLWSIAMAHSIDVETLIWCNSGIKALTPGQILRIPNQYGIFYVFDEGDNIAEICGHYGVNVDKILSVNNLRNSRHI